MGGGGGGGDWICGVLKMGGVEYGGGGMCGEGGWIWVFKNMGGGGWRREGHHR